MKLKDIKRELNIISQNNDIALKTSLLKESILSSESKNWDEKADDPFSYSKLDPILDFKKNRNMIKRFTLTDSAAFSIKIKVKSEKLKERLTTVKTNFVPIDNLLLLDYVSFEFSSSNDEKQYENLLNCLFLVRNNYIINSPNLVNNVLTTEMKQNQYNQKALENWNNKTVKSKQAVWNYYNHKEELELEIEKSINFKFDFAKNKTIHKTALELLFKGDHTITIYFYKLTSEITKEGHSVMRTNWWKINWYLVFCGLSLFTSFTILTLYIINFLIIGHL